MNSLPFCKLQFQSHRHIARECRHVECVLREQFHEFMMQAVENSKMHYMLLTTHISNEIFWLFPIQTNQLIFKRYIIR